MRLRPGSPFPLGATWDGHGVNFAISSEHATNVELVLFDQSGSAHDGIPLAARTNRVWHAYLPGLGPGQLYGYRVHGPWAPAQGQRFNPRKVVLDPYARAIGRELTWHSSLFAFAEDATSDGPADDRDSAPYAPLGMVVDESFDWGSDASPRIPLSETVIYETHVKGFSRLHPDIDPRLRGTYLGLAAPAAIEHFRSLGITAVELLPVHAHVDERGLVRAGLVNYWGYNSISFFALDPRFATSPEPATVLREFKTMVRLLHAAGLEVLLDVVYNHSAEGDHGGPTLSLRGIDNRGYYRLDATNPARYQDFTGTGNTLDMRSPMALALVMDSLRYCVNDMHVDGFRFDLASALARESDHVDKGSAFFDVIAQDPVLSRVKLIAEPWDAGFDGYHVGNFPSGWTEWNGHYRDVVRRFWRGDAGMLPAMASRISGSRDLYGDAGRHPQASLNFVTCHDGFTLADLVSYEQKHNESNGEANRDGENNNLSWNCGIEGPTDDPGIIALRERQRRNFLVTLFMSLGVPMLSGGDELGRSQQGNNNPYCLDSDISWTHWTGSGADKTFHAFVSLLATLRQSQPVLRRRRFLDGRSGKASDVMWLRPDGQEMTNGDWQDADGRAFGMFLDGNAIAEVDDAGEPISGDSLLTILNAGDKAVNFTLPQTQHGQRWELLINTLNHGNGSTISGAVLIVASHSAVVLRVKR